MKGVKSMVQPVCRIEKGVQRSASGRTREMKYLGEVRERHAGARVAGHVESQGVKQYFCGGECGPPCRESPQRRTVSREKKNVRSESEEPR